MELEENERIDDLQYKNLKIIQNKDEFCFGIDAVLLSDFACSMQRGKVIVDLCSGTGVLAILLAEKIEAKKVYAVEIQKNMVEMMKRSIEINNQQDIINPINIDLKELDRELVAGSVDCVVVNPPYIKENGGLLNEYDGKTIARHEVYCTLEDVIKESSRLLNSNGNLFMVHRPDRLADILCTMRKYKIEPKRLKFVHSNINKEPNLLLIEGVKAGGSFLKIERPLYIYGEDGKYTSDIKKIYNMEEGV